MADIEKIRRMIQKEKENRKTEGYWYSKYAPEYPMPIPNVLTNEESINIFKLIQIKEKEARPVRYLGKLTSRITGETLGCSEYKLDNWVWPSDFAKHYVLTHRVRPTDGFLKFIGYIV